jgi:hypothetical protein
MVAKRFPTLKIVVPAAIVLLNYAAQIPYAWHLYGLRVSPTGAGLLLLTLVWFVVGLALLRVGRGKAGYWLTMSFLATDVVFYGYNAATGMLHGYGPLYHLTRQGDLLVSAVFFIGYVNVVAAAYLIWVLVGSRPGTATPAAG